MIEWVRTWDVGHWIWACILVGLLLDKIESIVKAARCKDGK